RGLGAGRLSRVADTSWRRLGWTAATQGSQALSQTNCQTAARQQGGLVRTLTCIAVRRHRTDRRGRTGLALRQLTQSNVLLTHPPVFRQANRHLIVVHVLIEAGLGTVQRVTLGEHLVGVTNALEHDIEEQRLELAGYPLHVLGTVGLTAGLHLGHGVEVGVAETRTVHVSTPQITIRSAFSAPACLSASRMAIRSPGAAPTWLTARTISSSDTPGLNTNMRPSPSSILTW